MHAAAPRPSAVAILSGIGLMSRKELCQLITLVDSTSAFAVVGGAAKGLAKKIKLISDEQVSEIAVQSARLEASAHSDDMLRHRLWHAMASGLCIPAATPFSSRTATLAATALAVRASERLSPSLTEEPSPPDPADVDAGWTAWAGKMAMTFAKKGQDLFKATPALPFHELVEREMLRLLADKETMQAAVAEADPEVAEALRRSHSAALAAMGLGGGWVAFAQIVGAAGFAPYILAAQASAWIPFVSGPGLVSFLAVIVNPLTLLVGVGALVWLGTSKIENVVRSQVSARLCVLLAIRGVGQSEEGLSEFIASMRRLMIEPKSAFAHLTSAERDQHIGRVQAIIGRNAAKPGAPAGVPPRPWNDRLPPRKQNGDLIDGMLISTRTAGEMLWHAAAIDPNVIAAADFSRAADLGDPIAFALHAQNFVIPVADHSLRGYVAERLVLDRLVQQGHHVELPESSNMPGLDLIVDGAPVQVKAGNRIDLLDAHFEKYPDIPVITPVRRYSGPGWSRSNWKPR